MVNRCRFAQSVIVPGTVGDEQRTHLTQPGIVFRENFQNRRIFEMILKNPAFLVENAVILRQRRVIVGPQSAQPGITEPPPLGSAHLENHQILRAEQHRGQHTGDFRQSLLFHPVAEDLPGTASGEQNKP